MLRPEKREVLILMRMKPQDHPSQRTEPAEFSNIVEVHVTHFGNPRRIRFCHIFPRELDD